MAKTDRRHKAEKHIKTDVPRRQITNLIWVRDTIEHQSASTVTHAAFCRLNILILNVASEAIILYILVARSEYLCYSSIHQAEVAAHMKM